MKKTNKKGFTIVELVIVIAIIAVLAAVLIPTFAGVIKKANFSADQQAIRQMNTVLATGDDLATIADVKALLAENGFDANDYKPLSKDHDFYWVPNLNRMVLVDADKKVVAPDDLTDETFGADWKSLSGNGNAAAVDAIQTAVGKGDNYVVEGTVNFSGASVNLKPADDFTFGGTVEAPATIENVVSDEGSKVASNTGEWADNTYYAGLISIVPAGKTVVVENLTIKDAVIGDTVKPLESARAGIIAGQVNGTLIIRNVTIENSSVFGSYRIGALVGAVGSAGKVVIENVTIKNTTVKGDSFTAALIGQVSNMAADAVQIANVTTDNLTVTALTSNDWIVEYNGDKYALFNYGEGDTDNWQAMPYLTDDYYWIKAGDAFATSDAKGAYKQSVYETRK